MTGDDIQRIAMHWLERGNESDAVLILASETAPTVREDGKLFERFLAEQGAAPQGSSRERDFWIVTRFLLQRIADGSMDPLPVAWDLINYVDWDDVQLFTRPDLPPLEMRQPPGARYAGEFIGLEHFLGAVFSLDAEDLQPAEVASLVQSVRDEAANALKRFYTHMPESFPAAPL